MFVRAGGFAAKRVESAEHRAARVPRPFYRMTALSIRYIQHLPQETWNKPLFSVYDPDTKRSLVYIFTALNSGNSGSTGFLTRNRKSAGW
ncbi:hypothetical protein [Nocardia araoensis]|uniref:hypothetical protein n=1 Tax=Nocardia araoensis TaxID=228600 RepID=UPI0012F6565A|nr:hypothetical protein [Nocardia araoensis]